MSIDNKIILKPWGYEYSVYENKSFSVWLLHIKENEFTSMHCHPRKKTKLILLDGQAKISLLSEDKIINPLSFVFFDRGQFHSTRAMSKNGIYLLEIESPVDKDDLVRLSDKYGRENKNYEFDSYKISTSERFHINFDDNSLINFSGCDFNLVNYISFSDLPCEDNCIFIMLEGSIKCILNNKKHNLIIPGDVIKSKDFSLIKNKISQVSKDCKILVVSKR